MTNNMQKTLHLERLVPRGFIWIWVPKHFAHKVTLALEDLRFFYVESLTWIKMHVNNRISMSKSRYFNNSKLTMYIFRRRDKTGRTYPIDMRHQRNSDVHLGFIRTDSETHRELRPDEHVCKLVETMLPPEPARHFLFLYVCVCGSIHENCGPFRGERSDLARERNSWTWICDTLTVYRGTEKDDIF